MKTILTALAVAALASGAAAASNHLAFTGARSQAKISLAQARAAALAARPGKITDQELEKEGGGSGLRYSFDVLSAGKVWEVGIDAKTGKVLENDRESANPD
ncbi:MAG TPA: PepSY domain-containing protein [Caulobacteraceae bacterium]|nr:PepSY domain-containing protein [Caulobacteraceae bacterium]